MRALSYALLLVVSFSCSSPPASPPTPAPDPCNPNPCENGGTCSDVTPSCSSRADYFRDRFLSCVRDTSFCGGRSQSCAEFCSGWMGCEGEVAINSDGHQTIEGVVSSREAECSCAQGFEGYRCADAVKPAPAAPTGLTATSTATQATLSWSAVTDATRYNILRSSTAGSGYTQIGTSATTSYSDPPTGTLAAGAYHYVVQAVASSVASGNSNQASTFVGRKVCVTTESGVSVHAGQVGGDVAPVRAITGNLTGFTSRAHGLAYSGSEALLFTSVPQDTKILTFSSSASGDIAPTRTLTGAATTLVYPLALAHDSTNAEVYVAEPLGPAIRVYAAVMNGDQAPVRVITGNDLVYPRDVAYDPVNQELIVADTNGQMVTVFDRTADGASTAKRKITSLNPGPQGVAVDTTHDEIWVTRNDRIDVFDRTATSSTPKRSLVGATTELSGPRGIALDLLNGEVYVAQNGSSTLLVFSRSASGDVAPLRKIAGAATTLAQLNSVALCD